jgi:hypothetical protein
MDELKESNQLSAADIDAFAVLDATSAADVELMRSWTSADPDLLDDGELRRLLTAMLHSFGLLRRFRISPTAMAGFVADVASHMNDNPFHHFRHCFMVTLTAWRMIDLSSAAANTLGDLGILSLLLAAMCHVRPSRPSRRAAPYLMMFASHALSPRLPQDLEHPGTTNNFQVNTNSALAIRYNDTSVLENHHASCGFMLLDRAGLLRNLPAHEFRALRKAVLAAIIATDSAFPRYGYCGCCLHALNACAIHSASRSERAQRAAEPSDCACGRRRVGRCGSWTSHRHAQGF